MFFHFQEEMWGIEDIDIRSQTMMKMDLFAFFSYSRIETKEEYETVWMNLHIYGETIVDNDGVVVAQGHSGVENPKFCHEQKIKGDFTFVAAVVKQIRIKSVILQEKSCAIDVSASSDRVLA
jgi:hypothetical protein